SLLRCPARHRGCSRAAHAPQIRRPEACLILREMHLNLENMINYENISLTVRRCDRPIDDRMSLFQRDEVGWTGDDSADRRNHGAAKAAILMPAASSRARTRRAMVTALGESPCVEIDPIEVLSRVPA